MTSPMVMQLIGRASALRQQLERERTRPDAPPTRLLRLQAIILKLQWRLESLLRAHALQPIAIPVRAARRTDSHR